MAIDPNAEFNPDMCKDNVSPVQQMEELVDLVLLDATRIQQAWIRCRDWYREKLRKAAENSPN